MTSARGLSLLCKIILLTAIICQCKSQSVSNSACLESVVDTPLAHTLDVKWSVEGLKGYYETVKKFRRPLSIKTSLKRTGDKSDEYFHYDIESHFASTGMDVSLRIDTNSTAFNNGTVFEVKLNISSFSAEDGMTTEMTGVANTGSLDELQFNWNWRQNIFEDNESYGRYYYGTTSKYNNPYESHSDVPTYRKDSIRVSHEGTTATPWYTTRGHWGTNFTYAATPAPTTVKTMMSSFANAYLTEVKPQTVGKSEVTFQFQLTGMQLQENLVFEENNIKSC